MLIVHYFLSFINLLTEKRNQKIAQEECATPILLGFLPLLLQDSHCQLRQASSVAQIEREPAISHEQLRSGQQVIVLQQQHSQISYHPSSLSCRTHSRIQPGHICPNQYLFSCVPITGSKCPDDSGGNYCIGMKALLIHHQERGSTEFFDWTSAERANDCQRRLSKRNLGYREDL